MSYIIFGLVIIVYPFIAVIVHALFERRSILTYGLTFKERLEKYSGRDPEWITALREESFAGGVSVVWPLSPLLIAGRWFYGKTSGLLAWCNARMSALHKYVKTARLESKGATEDDSEQGAYRSTHISASERSPIRSTGKRSTRQHISASM